MTVLSAIAIVPSAPLLVPELASAAAGETEDARAAAISAAAALPSRWIAVGVAQDDGVYGPAAAGTFAGYGVDVRIALSPQAAGADPVALPLCALIAGWLRGQACPDATVEVHTLPGDLPAAAAVDHGKALRDRLDADADAVGVLIVADGANTLTPAAPGGYDEHSPAVQAALDDALAAGDPAALTQLPDSVLGRPAYQVLAGLTGSRPQGAEELYRGAPYGVGYFVGVWTP